MSIYHSFIFVGKLDMKYGICLYMIVFGKVLSIRGFLDKVTIL